MAHAATDYFMTVTPVGGQPTLKGDSLDTYYQPKGAIDITSFRWSAENTVSLGTASGGAGAGKAQLGDLTVEKAVDSTTPQFLRNLTTGQHFQRVQIFARKAGTPIRPGPPTASPWSSSTPRSSPAASATMCRPRS